MKIQEVTNYKTAKCIVHLIENTEEVENIKINDNEKTYMRTCIKKEKNLFSVNTYMQWHLVYYFKKSNKPIHEKMETLRKAGKKIHATIKNLNQENIVLASQLKNDSLSYSFIEGLLLSNYSFKKYFTDQKSNKDTDIKTLKISRNTLSRDQISELQALQAGVFIARDLVNEPLSALTAVELSEKIRELGQKVNLKVEIFNKKKIEALKMGGLLAVNRGSIDPPTFSIIEWKPKNARNKKPVALIGKGVVFDTGGMNLKPGKSMETMKADMAGAAAVIGAMTCIAEMKLPTHVIAFIPATDNRPGQNAYVPQDIITMYNGKTVEVLNTDAEGRMILADALSFSSKYKPELVIDIATLTGSAHAAVGPMAMVGMGNANKKLISKLIKSGELMHERVVEFPFWDEYADMLKSDIADMKNIGGAVAGAITAGKFLEKFTNHPYIHLDIAGVAFNHNTLSYRGKGGSGIGVRLLYDFIKNLH